MTNIKLLVWGYFLLFFSIYLGSIAYGALPAIFHNDVIDTLPQTEYTSEINATIAGMNSAPSTLYAGLILIVVGTILMALYGMVSTFNAY